MNWHIAGVGSIGTLWASRLYRAGIPIRLLLRDQQHLLRYQQAGGLTLGAGTDLQRYPVTAQTLADDQPITRLLVACKAYDSLPLIRQLQHRLVPQSQVILLQNGLGSQQQVQAALPGSHCIFASTTEGAWLQQDFHCIPAGKGHTWLGSVPASPAPAWLEDLRQAGIEHDWTPGIMGHLWRKLAINCAINPLTVLYQCRNGDLLAHTHQLQALCQELQHLLHASGFGDAGQDLYATVEQVVRATAGNYSSMYQDVRKGRRTEQAYLLGYACAQAKAFGLALPGLQALHQQLLDELRTRGLPSI